MRLDVNLIIPTYLIKITGLCLFIYLFHGSVIRYGWKILKVVRPIYITFTMEKFLRKLYEGIQENAS